ncbi:MAG: hypothetical protein IJV27_05660 [Prevotella sp.]|nr:hypothetical protein [Prevotella sp.]
MKQKSLFAMLLLCLLLGACGKNNPEESQLDDRLVGTIWQTDDDVSHLFYGGTCYLIYEFISTTQLESYTKRNGSVYKSWGTLDYELDYPKLVIHEKQSDGTIRDDHYTFKDSRTFTLDGTPGTMAYQIFIRQ